MKNDKLEWARNAAKELAMDSAHIPLIEAVILKHYNTRNSTKKDTQPTENQPK